MVRGGMVFRKSPFEGDARYFPSDGTGGGRFEVFCEPRVRGFSVYYSCLSTVCAEQASAESGEWVDEAAHAWDGGRATASGMMEAG
eukprot:436566-Prorocentrum_minimum.AAC.1